MAGWREMVDLRLSTVAVSVFSSEEADRSEIHPKSLLLNPTIAVRCGRKQCTTMQGLYISFCSEPQPPQAMGHKETENAETMTSEL